MRMALRLWLVVAVLGSLVAPRAQEVVAAKPFLVVELDGPESFARRFATTNVGSMLAAKEAGKFWDGVRKALLAGPMAEPQWLCDSVGAALEGLRGYGGRITIALAVEPAEPADVGLGPIHGIVVLAPDGTTDLAALAERLATVLEKAGAVKAVKVGDVEQRVVVGESGVGFTVPRVVDDKLVTWISGRITTGLAQAQALRAAALADPEAKASAFVAQLDLASLLAQARGFLTREDKDGKAWARIGVPSLRDLRWSVRAAGPRVMVETSVGFGPEDRGLFDVLMPAIPAPPALLPLVPANAGEWTASKFRVDRLAEIVLALMAHFEVKETLADDENPFRFVLPDYLQLGNLLAVKMGGGMFDPLGDFTIAVRVKEPAAYAAALAKFLARVEQTPVELENAERFGKGTKAVRIPLLGMVPIVHAQRDDLVVIAHGDEAEERVARLLAQPPGEPPPEIAARKALHPPGFHGCGRVDVQGVLVTPPGGFLLSALFGAPFRFVMFGEEQPPAASPWEEAVASIRPLLEQHELHWGWTFAGCHEGRYRHRVVW